jgi:DNA-directed RNA polymerase subunit RPC12/RpoP
MNSSSPVYICSGCGKKFLKDEIKTVKCNKCSSKFFRKEQTTKIIRLKAV